MQGPHFRLYLHAHTRGRQHLPSWRPIEWVVRVVRRRRYENNVFLDPRRMFGPQCSLEIDQMDRSGDGSCLIHSSYQAGYNYEYQKERINPSRESRDFDTRAIRKLYGSPSFYRSLDGYATLLIKL